MPRVKIETAASRGEGVFDGMHPVFTEDGEGCEVILLPDDLTRGKGNFLLDRGGNPEGFSLVQLPTIVSSDIFMGSTQNRTTKQNDLPIPVTEAAYMVNGPLLTGDEEPDELLIASLPKPLPPTIKVRSAAVAGYQLSTPEHPYYLALSGYRNGKHTPLGPPVKLPPLAQGECFRAKVPDNVSEGATHIGWWLSAPGESTPSTTGQMHLQKLTLIGSYVGEIPFRGPYLFSRERPGGTSLGIPASPSATLSRERYACRIGSFVFRTTAANDLGETLPSGFSSQLLVAGDAQFADEQGKPKAGIGRLRITRGVLPSGSSGWFLYVLVGNQWHRIYNKFTGEGLSKPLPLSLTQVVTGGWEGSEEFALNETMLLSSGSPPTEDTTVISTPTSAPDTPVIFGATRPGPGRYFAKQLDRSEDGDQSPLSEASYADVGENEVMEVILANPTTKLTNASLVRKGADGYPLGYSVVGSGVTLEERELVLDASASPVITTDVVSVNTHQQWSVGALIKALNPKTGAFGGTFEVVLREINAGAVHTDTIIHSISALGEHTFYSSVSSSDSSPLQWQADTQGAQLVYRFQGSSNMLVRISEPLLNDYAYSFTAREAGIALVPSPAPGTSPETLAQTPPDRPKLASEVLDTQEFSGDVPWTTDVVNATLATSSGKLIASKTAGGSAGQASIHQTFVPESGLTARHSLGIAVEGLTIPTLPANGSITLLELRRPVDGARYGWIDADTRSEVAKLRINSPPRSSGNISTTLDEGGIPTTRTTSLVATREKSTLTIMAAPLSSGLIGIGLNGITTDIAVTTGQTGHPEIVQVEITRGAAGSGLIGIRLGAPQGSGKTSTLLTAPVYRGDTQSGVADRIRSAATNPSWQNEPWTIAGTGRFITFTAKLSAPTHGEHSFIPTVYLVHGQGLGETHVQASVNVTQIGQVEIFADTENSIAQRIAETVFADYSATQDGLNVIFEALEAGPRVDATFDARATGVIASITQDVQGAQDTTQDVASKILTTYAANAYHSLTRSGSLITISALSAGAKQDATFDAGSTGLGAEIATSIQGSGDLVAYVKDQFGALRQRRIFTNITSSISYNLDLNGAGGGYTPEGEHSKAVIQVWGSTGADPRTLIGLFEDVDLGEYPAGGVAAGVTSESTSALTWDVSIDRVQVSARGVIHYDYHDYRGRLVNQLRLLFDPRLLPSEGYGIEDFRIAVLPETTYTASIFARWAGFRDTVEPFYLYCLTPEGELNPLRDLTPLGVTGTQEWGEWLYTFTTPRNCYELMFISKTVAGGELVAQKFVVSKGTTAKRTDLYATEGSYVSTLDLATPHAYPDHLYGRERKTLEADIWMPDETSASVLYRARTDATGGYGAPVSNPSLLEQKNQIRIDISASGNGVETPVVRSGSPSAEYILLSSGQLLPTLLRADRTELEGGAFFVNLEQYAEPPEVNVTTLPGRRFVRFATYPPVGNQPGYELQVFTPEARKYLEDRLGLVDVVIEAWDKIVTIRHGPGSQRIVFESQGAESKINGRWYGWYVAKFPEGQVIDVRDLPA